MSASGHDGGDGLTDPLEAFTGDRSSAEQLRDNLTRIAEQHPDTPVAAITTDVLTGRRPVRDLAVDPDFAEIIRTGVNDYRRYLESLTPAERAEMVQSAARSASQQPHSE